MSLLSVMVVTDWRAIGIFGVSEEGRWSLIVLISGIIFVMMKAFWDRYSEKGVMP